MGGEETWYAFLARHPQAVEYVNRANRVAVSFATQARYGSECA